MTYSKREQRAWYMYDWANSAFAVTTIALFLGPYLTALAKSAADPQGQVHPLGIHAGLNVDPRSYWSYLVSLSVILQVLVLPFVGAIVDASNRKKLYLGITAYLGASTAAAMFFLRGSMYIWGGILFILANVSFGASVVIYNSFLPDIAPPEQRDAVSSRGWGIGYIGGGVLLALNLVLFLNAEKLGMTEALAVRISLCSAGVWWGLFTIPTLLGLRSRQAKIVIAPSAETRLADNSTQINNSLWNREQDARTNDAPFARSAFTRLRHTIGEIRRYPQTVTFLIAYLLYNDAIQAVLALASQFGNDELKIPVSKLTLAILMVQFVGFFGAIGFQWVAARVGAKSAILVTLFLWTATLIYIYAAVKTTADFFIAAAIIALVMGGSQALSRSLFAQLIPTGKEAEYFSVYEISDKGTSWLCPLLFGLALQFTRSYRLAILSLIIFFIAGFFVLLRLNVQKGEAAVLTTASSI